MKKITLRHPTDKNVLKFVGSNDRVIVQNSCRRDISIQNIISNIEKRLLSGFVFVHMERVVNLSGKYALSPYFDRIDRRVKVFNLRLLENSFLTNLIQP